MYWNSHDLIDGNRRYSAKKAPALNTPPPPPHNNDDYNYNNDDNDTNDNNNNNDNNTKAACLNWAPVSTPNKVLGFTQETSMGAIFFFTVTRHNLLGVNWIKTRVVDGYKQ